MKLFKLGPVLALSLLVGACAQNIKSDVARFHQLQGVPAGATFAIVPQDETLECGLEFAQYAALVQRQLLEEGFQPARDGTAADLIVTMAYGVNDGDQVIRTRNTGFVGGPVGGAGFHPFFGGGFGRFGAFGAGGFGPDVYSYTAYTRGLNLQMYRPANGLAPKEVVFEGKVESVGRDNGLPEVMPYLIEAMFTDFPGQSGVTKEIVVEVPDS
ncbi:MAG: DUF4136 domain-containing protein [Pseudomonadota bacterium]